MEKITKTKKLVTLFGSFNPITKAHYMMMKEAMDKVGADIGLFVAAPQKYLEKKMHIKVGSPFLLPADKRIEMIESVCIEDKRLSFFGFELGSAAPNRAKTLLKMQKKYPDHEIHFLMGADRVRSLAKSFREDYENIMSSVKMIITSRGGIDIKKTIENDADLNARKNNFIFMELSDDIKEFSSTKLREKFFNGEDYSSMMNDGAYRIMSKYTPADFPAQTFEDKIKAQLKFGGRFAYNEVGMLVYEENKKLFDNWDEAMLGDRMNKVKSTKVYDKEFHVHSENNYDTKFDCLDADCVDVAEDLIEEGYNPAILNLASAIHPCGGYDKGKNAQEESLCQASTLSQSLYQFGEGGPKGKGARECGLPLIAGVYPLNRNFGGIYSPDVCFFRNNKYKFFSIREKPFSCGVITVASLSNRQKNEWTNDESVFFNTDGTLTEEGVEIEKNKIRTIYRIGLENGHDSLVLGAFGCGVYKLIPAEVANLFMDVLNEEEFKNKYKKIVFAILEGKKRGVLHGEDGKFKAFYDLFQS